MENTKGRGLLVASRLVGYIGVGACLLSAIAYMVMHLANVNMDFIGGFSWDSLIYVAIAAAAFVLIAVVLRIASNALRNKADDVVEEVAEEAPVEESVEEAPVEEIAEECEEVEATECEEEVVEEETCAVCKKFHITPEQKEKLIATVKANKNVIIAVAATATVSAIIASNAAKRRKAKIRRNILDLLY